MNILIVKTSSLGDIIHAFPVLNYLKLRYPASRIDWVVEHSFADLVQTHPLVSEVFRIQTKQWRTHPFKRETWQEISKFKQALRQKEYQLVLDLQGNVKSAWVTSCIKSKFKVGFGYATVPEWPNILTTHRRYNPPVGQNVRNDYLFLAQSACEDFTSIDEAKVQLKLTPQEEEQVNSLFRPLEGLKVAVCPGSNWPNKKLALETLNIFLQEMSQHFNPHFLFLWGDKHEKAEVEKLASSLSNSKVVDKLSLPALQRVMEKSNLVLAMDSLPLHLAGTTSTPTFSIFGPSSAAKYKPTGKLHHAYQGNCPYGQAFNKRCEKLRTCPTGACMKEIDGQALFEYFLKWWNERERNGSIIRDDRSFIGS